MLTVGPWADPCGTAIQGRPAIELVQALRAPSPFKNQFNIEVLVSDIKLLRTDTTL